MLQRYWMVEHIAQINWFHWAWNTCSCFPLNSELPCCCMWTRKWKYWQDKLTKIYKNQIFLLYQPFFFAYYMPFTQTFQLAVPGAMFDWLIAELYILDLLFMTNCLQCFVTRETPVEKRHHQLELLLQLLVCYFEEQFSIDSNELTVATIPISLWRLVAKLSLSPLP